MLTWDPDNALSTAAPALDDLGDRISECAGFRRLNDGRSAEESRKKVVHGPQVDPWEEVIGGRATIADLEEILVRANAHFAPEDPADAREPDSISECPFVGGTFRIEIFRQLRKAELAKEGENGMYLAVNDCVTSIVEELQRKSNRGCSPRLRNVRLVQAMQFNDPLSDGAAGVFMFGAIEADWGDRGGES